MGCASTEQSKTFDYCFREDEITKLKKLKEEKMKQSIQDGNINEEAHVFPIYRKVEIDFTKKNIQLKEYLVLYLPKNYNKNTVEFKYTPTIHLIREYIEKKEYNEYFRYIKINSDVKAVTNFECKEDPDDYRNEAKLFLKFNITQRNKEEQAVTLEVGSDVKFIYEYGFIHFKSGHYNDQPNKTTFTIILDDNYIICDLLEDCLIEISKYNLYSFDKNGIEFFIKDKRIKVNIENILDKQLLSIFSPDEIKQIDNSFNTIKFKYDQTNLVYQKVIHNIKDKKDFTKIYDIVFYPHNTEGGEGYLMNKLPQPIIINKFKINNYEVEKKEYNENENDKNIQENDVLKGYYCFEGFLMEYHYIFKGIVGLYELDCESNDEMLVFQLNCNSLGFIKNSLIYGSPYRYEIILNGNKLQFFKKNFNYSEINGKIILEGKIDGNEENFDEELFNEIAKSKDKDSLIQLSKDEKIKYWPEFRLKAFIPDFMYFDDNK